MGFNPIRSLPITHNPENAWKNTVARALGAHNAIEGAGVAINYGPYGQTIKSEYVGEQYPVLYAGDYDFFQEYFPNEIVTVTQEILHTDIYDELIPFGNTSDDSFGVTPICPGTYICTAYVPPAACDEYYLNTFIAPQYGGQVPFDAVNSTRFIDYNIYYPIYPVIPTQYTASIVTPSGYAVVANQTFWTPLAATIKQTLCKDGVQTDIYVYAQLPSSSFEDMYLPYG